MKNIFYTLVAILIGVSVLSCTSTAEKQSGKMISDENSRKEMKVDSALDSLSDNDDVKNVSLQSSKKEVTPDSDADELLKQYSATFINMVQASKQGKNVDPADTQKIIDFQNQLDKLEKSGQLTDVQKQLFKVTNDAYNAFKKK